MSSHATYLASPRVTSCGTVVQCHSEDAAVAAVGNYGIFTKLPFLNFHTFFPSYLHLCNYVTWLKLRSV